MPFRSFYRFLDTVGDGSGTKNAVGDYSTPTDFKLTNPAAANGIMEVERLMVQIEDNAAVSAESYGGLSALSNGVILLVVDGDGDTVVNITDDQPIKSNGHWAQFCFDVTIDIFPGTNNFVEVRWTFAKAGAPVVLKPGWSLIARMQDNLTGLVTHMLNAQGIVK